MAIAKKPKSNQKISPSSHKETAAQAFISGAGNGSTLDADTTTKKPVMIRFDPALLTRVDAAAKRRGISRSAWIQYTVSFALDQDDG